MLSLAGSAHCATLERQLIHMAFLPCAEPNEEIKIINKLPINTPVRNSQFGSTQVQHMNQPSL